MIALHQIEVIRAIMIAGTADGAARLLDVSAPGGGRTVSLARPGIRHKSAESDANRPAASHISFILTPNSRSSL